MANKKILWVWTLLAHTLLIVFSFYLIEEKISTDKANLWNWGWTVISIQALHFILSFKIVGPTELGAVLFFGKPLFQVYAGPVFVPFLVCKIAKEDGTTIKKQFPEEPELVDKSGDDTKPVKPGFVKPIRVATASYNMLSDDMKKKIKNTDKDDPLNKMLVVEPSVVVRFQIVDYLSFLKNIGSVEKAVSQMRDTVDSALNIEFPKRTPILLTQDKEAVNIELLNKIEILVGDQDNQTVRLLPVKKIKSWGINVISVQIADLDLSKGIHTSIREIANSQLKKTTTITEAQGAKEKKTLEGEGEKEFETKKGAGVASARLALLEAEAKGLKEISEIAKTPEGRVAVIAKTQEEALKNARYSIIPEGIGSLISGVQEILKKTKSPDDDDDGKMGGKK